MPSIHSSGCPRLEGGRIRGITVLIPLGIGRCFHGSGATSDTLAELQFTMDQNEMGFSSLHLFTELNVRLAKELKAARIANS